MKEKKSIALIADAHASPGLLGKEHEFFEMLKHLAKRKVDIVFMGDVFELWIALPGYENQMHKRFASFCRDLSRTRMVGFIEGNHEFQVKRMRSRDFSWCEESIKILPGGVLLEHGDLINSKDVKYRAMRAAFKSRLACWLLQTLSFVGPDIAEWLRVSLKSTNMEHKKGIPFEMLKDYAGAFSKKGVGKVAIGHFHQEGRIVSNSGVEMLLLPSWRDEGRICLLKPNSGQAEILHWKKV